MTVIKIFIVKKKDSIFILILFLKFFINNLWLFPQQILYMRGKIVAEEFVLANNYRVFVKNKSFFPNKISIEFRLRYELGIWIIPVKLVFRRLGKKKLRRKQCGRKGD